MKTKNETGEEGEELEDTCISMNMMVEQWPTKNHSKDRILNPFSNEKLCTPNQALIT